MGEAASAGREKLVDASSCEIEWTEDSDRFHQSTSTAIFFFFEKFIHGNLDGLHECHDPVLLIMESGPARFPVIITMGPRYSSSVFFFEGFFISLLV